jgi:hypothetical protein
MTLNTSIHGLARYGGRRSQIAVDMLGPVEGFADPLDHDAACESNGSREDRISELQAKRAALALELEDLDAEIEKIRREGRR